LIVQTLEQYLSLIIWWLIFFATHSLLASTKAKRLVNDLPPAFKSYYRLFFNIVSGILLIPLGLSYHSLPNEYVFTPTLPLQLVGGLLLIAGTYVVIAGFKNYRADEFFGTYQLKNKHEFHPVKLSRSGWNGAVRHPLYFGNILLIVGLFLIFPNVKLGITTILVISYLYIGTLWEEKKLLMEFGETYRQYQREVSMHLPVKWILKRLRKMI
jgi:methanethiol S-methyltransferase